MAKTFLLIAAVILFICYFLHCKKVAINAIERLRIKIAANKEEFDRVLNKIVMNHIYEETDNYFDRNVDIYLIENVNGKIIVTGVNNAKQQIFTASQYKKILSKTTEDSLIYKIHIDSFSLFYKLEPLYEGSFLKIDYHSPNF